MSEAKPRESLLGAFDRALAESAASQSGLQAFVVEGSLPHSAEGFLERFPGRSVSVPATGSAWIPPAVARASPTSPVFGVGPSAQVLGQWYEMVRAACAARTNLKLVATDGGFPAHPAVPSRPMMEDIGLMRGLAGMTVVVPADAPTTRSAVGALAGFAGPAYLRLTPEPLTAVTEAPFEIGRAALLRSGADLTIVAVGALVGRALDVAEELGRVGVSVRVLDFASVKPYDEKALLRAARETGAILTMEEHSILTGVGSLVASTTAEEYPVPVRRVGVPDLFLEAADPGAGRDRYGMSKERCLEEAFGLLKVRGKVQ